MIVARGVRVMTVAGTITGTAAMVVVIVVETAAADLPEEILTVVDRLVNKIKQGKSPQLWGFSIFRQWK